VRRQSQVNCGVVSGSATCMAKRRAICLRFGYLNCVYFTNELQTLSSVAMLLYFNAKVKVKFALE
jgi:hypothetical protein